MKNLFTIIFIVFLASACDGSGWESEPVGTVECTDNWDQAYDAGIADMSDEIERLQSEIESLETENEYAQIDWQFRAETAESELLNVRGQLDIITKQTEGDIQRATEFRNALRLFDLSEPCDNGQIDETICKAFFSGNL